jgi:glycerate-2-kinase
MERCCEVCGEPFEAKRKTARFCTDRCRMRAHRRPAETEQTPPVASPDRGERQEDAVSLAQAAQAELQAAGREATAVGRAVLALARRIDANASETGSSLAAMVREFRAAHADALKGAGEAGDPVDELKARRDRKRAG